MPVLAKNIKIKDTILEVIDFFYPLLRPFIDLKTFRYLVVGSTNTAFDILLYFISYNFIIAKKNVHVFSWLVISPHIAAFILAFVVSFATGFMLMRTLVFPESILRGRTQLFRYFSVALLNIFLNYLLIKLFVEQCHIYPTPSKILTTGIVIVISYLLQRFFTFR